MTKLKTSLCFLMAIILLCQEAAHAQILATLGTSPLTFGVDSNAILMSTGTENGTAVLTSGEEGAGTRMLWYPGKAVFRAGYVSSTQWDDTNVGNYSVALGYNTKASGSYSFAMGSGSSATNSGATAFGGGSASGSNSFAAASGIASGSSSFALGFSSSASGGSSAAFGTITTASGSNSFAAGGGAMASGSNSVAIGGAPISSGTDSAAFNNYGRATGSNTAAFNDNTIAGSFDSFVVGRYNVGGYGTSPTNGQTTWLPTDPLFEVGNGTGTGANTSDALVVYKNGNVQAQGSIRCSPGGDLSMGSFTAGTAP